MNIAINARDSMMPGGGVVRIRTSDTVLTRDTCERQQIDVSFKNGLDALDVIQNSPDIDLVILDLVMPDWNGIKTYGELRKINPDVKVLLSSG